MIIKRMILLVLVLALVVAGCGREESIAPVAGNNDIVYTGDKDGTEALGTPSIAIADGSGFAEGGVGMVGVDSATLTIDVPAGATINQVLVYWAGGTTGAPGDDTIELDGNAVQGTLIGGPTDFFAINSTHYYFHAFRADITGMELVNVGSNSFTVTGFEFDETGGPLDENNGVSILVIYDDGAEADLSLVDGLDMAFFNFQPTLDATVPQTFTFAAEDADRTASLFVAAASVGEGRPNEIKVTTIAGDQMFIDVLGSNDLPLWDSMLIDVLVPAGATELTVEIISTESTDPLGASLGWLASGLAVPVTPVIPAEDCRVTGGGNSTFEGDGGMNDYTFGGQAGAPLASQPQPWGNWTHHQKSGVSGSFVFHAGTPSAPEGTEIDWISCSDPGWCRQARPAPAKQIDFGGVGTFKNMKDVPAEIADHIVVGESLHWFEVNIDDLGEPGGHDDPGFCDPLGYGRNGGAELADCDCPDFYRIRIYSGSTDATDVMYEVYGYIDNGNLQIHPPTGRDRNLNR